MKKREISLDFTSLLDVTLILIFFFVMFSNFQQNEGSEKVQQAEQQAAEQIAEAEIKVSEAEEAVRDLEEQISHYSGRNAENAEAVAAFGNGEVLKIQLQMNPDATSWNLIINDEATIASEDIQGNSEKLQQNIEEIMEQKGYQASDTILCIFEYFGSQDGSNSAYEELQNVFKQLKFKYSFFMIYESNVNI